MRAYSDHANTTILKMLGIQHSGLGSVDIHLKPGKPPIAVLQQLVVDLPPVGDEFAQRTVCLQWVETPEPPAAFDLDAACANALERVRKHVRRQANNASTSLWNQHVQAVKASNQRHYQTQIDHCDRSGNYRAAFVMEQGIKQDEQLLEIEGFR